MCAYTKGRRLHSESMQHFFQVLTNAAIYFRKPRQRSRNVQYFDRDLCRKLAELLKTLAQHRTVRRKFLVRKVIQAVPEKDRCGRRPLQCAGPYRIVRRWRPQRTLYGRKFTHTHTQVFDIPVRPVVGNRRRHHALSTPGQNKMLVRAEAMSMRQEMLHQRGLASAGFSEKPNDRTIHHHCPCME